MARTAWWIGAIAAVPVSIAAWGAAPAQPAQATQPAQTQSVALRGRITGVEGIVALRRGPEAAWERAVVGMEVDQGVEFRTGPKSAVRVEIPPGQTITLDRLGTMTLIEAARGADAVKTDIGMKYGRVRYDVEAAGENYDAKIHSPGCTLAVRGTKVSVFDQGFFPVTVTSLTGKASHRDRGGSARSLGGRSPAQIIGDADAAAWTALNLTYLDAFIPGARTREEREFILDRPLLAAFYVNQIATGNARRLPEVFTVEPRPEPDDIATGSLVFQLAWVSLMPGYDAPDLDLHVQSPLGDRVSPKGGTPISASGGRQPRDDRGGAGSRSEAAAWIGAYPLGVYRYSAQHVSGEPALYQLAVIRNGKVAGEPAGGELSASSPRADFEVNIGRAPAAGKTARPRKR